MVSRSSQMMRQSKASSESATAVGFSNTLTTGSTPVLAQPSKVKQGGRLDFICPIVFSKLWGRVHICGNFHSSLTLCSGLAGYGDEVLACPGGGQGEQEEEGEEHLLKVGVLFLVRPNDICKERVPA